MDGDPGQEPCVDSVIVIRMPANNPMDNVSILSVLGAWILPSPPSQCLGSISYSCTTTYVVVVRRPAAAMWHSHSHSDGQTGDM